MSKALVSRRIWYYGDMGAGVGSPAMEDAGPVEVAVPWKVLLSQEVLVLREVVILRKRRVLWVCWCQEECWHLQ